MLQKQTAEQKDMHSRQSARTPLIITPASLCLFVFLSTTLINYPGYFICTVFSLFPWNDPLGFWGAIILKTLFSCFASLTAEQVAVMATAVCLSFQY